MTAALIAAALFLAALLVAAYRAGVHREHRRTAADFTFLKGELDSTHAALMAIPDWDADSVAHRQAVALEHQRRQAEPRLRLDLYFGGGRRAA